MRLGGGVAGVNVGGLALASALALGQRPKPGAVGVAHYPEAKTETALILGFHQLNIYATCVSPVSLTPAPHQAQVRKGPRQGHL